MFLLLLLLLCVFGRLGAAEAIALAGSRGHSVVVLESATGWLVPVGRIERELLFLTVESLGRLHFQHFGEPGAMLQGRFSGGGVAKGEGGRAGEGGRPREPGRNSPTNT